jgi:hypothetical protein
VKAESDVADNTSNCEDVRDRKAILFWDAQAAIDGTLEAWLPRLVASNEALDAALARLMDLYLRRHDLPEDTVLRQVEDALTRAAKSKSPF